MIILSTLGTGNYADACYALDGKQVSGTLFPSVLRQFYPDARLIVLMTDESEKNHAAALRKAVPDVEITKIPSGGSEEELWEIFGILAKLIPEKEEVILDITHGFRSLPTIILLAVSFLRIAKEIKLKRVLYGAYDARAGDHSVTPVFDLTPFVAMLDWAGATERFIETGNASKFTPLVQKSQEDPLNPVAKSMKALSNAIFSARGKEIVENATRLHRAIESAQTKREEWGPERAPISLLIDRIDSEFEPMGVAQEPWSMPEILKAQLHQIKWLASHGQYPAAASLAREWMVSLLLVKAGKTDWNAIVEQDAREAAEKWLGKQPHTNSRKTTAEATDARPTSLINLPQEAPKEVADAWSSLYGLRNDVMHFGMRTNPAKPSTVEDAARELYDKLRQAAKAMGIDLDTASG